MRIIGIDGFLNSAHSGQRITFAWLLMLCLGILGLNRATHATDTRFFHQIWQLEDGLPGPSVRAVIQSRDGYLWVATVEGLARFDGVRFTTVEPKTRTERDRQYFALTETSDGSLWTSTSNGLVRIKGNQRTYYSHANGLPSSYVLTVYEDKQNRIWIGHTEGLARFENGKFIPCTTNEGYIENKAVRAILQDRSGALWVGTANGLTCHKGSVVTRYHAPQLPTNAVHCLCESSDGSIWVGTSFGLGRYRNGVWTHYGEQEGLAHQTISSVYEDSSTNLWVGSFRRGVQLFENEKFTTVMIDGEMASDFDYMVPGYTFVITGDQEGSIWIGSSLGLNRLRKQIVRTFRKADGLAESSTTSVLESRNGDIWVGTFGGGVSRIRGDQITNWGEHKNIPSRVLALCEDQSGTLWLGCDGPGLFWLKEDGTVGSYNSAQGMNETVIKVIYQDSQQSLWIGGQNGLTRFRNGQFFAFPRQLNTIKVIRESKQGGLWIGSRQGLVRIDEDRLYTYNRNNSHASSHLRIDSYTLQAGTSNLLAWEGIGETQGEWRPNNNSEEMVNALYEDAEGTLWIGTEQGGLFRLKDNRFTSYPTVQTLFSRVLHIVEDDSGNLWMSSRNGIFGLSKKELNDYASGNADSINSVTYGKLDGMRRAQCNGIAQPAGWLARDGRIWFPTLAGVVAVDRKNIKINKLPPPVLIEEVSVGGNPVPESTHTFPAGAKDIEFKYTALSLQVPEKVRFKYFVEGFDAGWRATTSERFARYPHLPPGKYVFHVKACNNEGIWNESGACFEFTLPPQFHETQSFYALCAVGVLLSGFGIYRWRVRTLQQREVGLVQLVKERTQSLELEIAERKQAERALVESREMVLRQERLAAVGQLAAGVAHEFNNILTVIQGHAELLLENPDLDQESVKSLKQISSGVDRTAKLTQQMLAFSRKQVMQRKPVDLNEIIQQITSMLSRLLTENISLRCDYGSPISPIQADAGMIEQILMNLAVNARDAMPKGGDLVMSTCQVTFGAADVHSHPERRPGDFVRLNVSDTGCGMDQATINRIFEPFFTTKEVGKGTGLGLATVYGIVKQHQGWIEVASEPGKGTSFRIYFPTQGSEAVASTLAERTTPSTRRGGETILVVEDEEVLRELVREILEAQGYRILEAAHGVQGLQVWKEHRKEIDLLFTDVVMPEGISGRELAQRIRAEAPELPIVFSTGYSQEMVDFNLQSHQRVTILSKPFHPAELVQTLRECLGNTRH